MNFYDFSSPLKMHFRIKKTPTSPSRPTRGPCPQTLTLCTRAPGSQPEAAAALPVLPLSLYSLSPSSDFLSLSSLSSLAALSPRPCQAASRAQPPRDARPHRAMPSSPRDACSTPCTEPPSSRALRASDRAPEFAEPLCSLLPAETDEPRPFLR